MNPRTIQPKQGDGFLQWNAGGWFGGMLGSSCWLAAVAIQFASREPTLSLLLSLMFANTVAFTAILWRFRDRISPFAAYQTGIALVGIMAAIAMAVMQDFGLLAAIDPRFQGNPAKAYLMLLIYPGLMISFGFKEALARFSRPAPKPSPSPVQEI